jgi:CDP-diacylglycerol--glycerol-3-phosphate 3-phosphatidyltransferase
VSLANKLTFFRVTLAPLFFVIYLIRNFFPSLAESSIAWTVPVLWLIFIVSEVTDLLDGIAARKRKEVSDFGKLFDPFADTLMQITCFLCFVVDGIFPAKLFLLVLYREFSILFIRNLMLRKGIAMGASLAGKIKTVLYIVAGGAALLAASIQRLGVLEDYFKYFKYGAITIFIISVIMSIVSFIQYLQVYRKTVNERDGL